MVRWISLTYGLLSWLITWWLSKLCELACMYTSPVFSIKSPFHSTTICTAEILAYLHVWSKDVKKKMFKALSTSKDSVNIDAIIRGLEFTPGLSLLAWMLQIMYSNCLFITQADASSCLLELNLEEYLKRKKLLLGRYNGSWWLQVV